MLDYRNLIDPILKRGDTSRMRAFMDSTEFQGRKYNASMDTSMTLGESASYIGSEMARQAPGAACHFMAGVYDGLSHLPAVGGVFKKSAAEFRNLAGELDNMTGASDVGREWRNGVASTAGAIDSVLLNYGAAAEYMAVQGASTLYQGAKIAETAVDTVEQIKEFNEIYEQGKFYWDAALKSVDVAGLLVLDISSGDWEAVLKDVDKIFDAVIDSVDRWLREK